MSSRSGAVAVAAFAFIAAAAVLIVPLFLLALVLAGPHSDVLPSFLQPVVLVLFWIALIGVPAWLAASVYQRRMRAGSELR